jgi:hypothetical protein
MPTGRRARRLQLAESVGVGVLLAALTAIVTWPQAALLTTHAHEHHDALFSMWRLSWIAEALAHQPARLFDAPIFHPELRTLAFSDAVLLQGLVATPALLAGAPIVPTYNLLLLAGPWLSALGMYLLLRSLLLPAGHEGAARSADGDAAAGATSPVVMWPALIGAVIFGLLPYRLEHIMHLELQWSQWMPLACWGLHRTVQRGRIADGALTAVCVLCQFLSCIYYGVFLVLVLAVAAPWLLLTRHRATLGRIAVAFIVGAVLTGPALVAYSAPYRANQQAFGGRAGWEIDTWSAKPGSFISTPPENRLYGAATATFGSPEGRLFPGALAVVLAIVGLVAARRRRETWMYGAALATSSLLALGTSTPVYGAMLAVAPPLRGLRAPARFGMLVALAIAVLAGLGAAALLTRLPRRGWRHAAGALVVLGLTVEYASEVGPLYAWPQRAPLYAMWLRQQPRGIVVEFPVPRAWALPNYDAEWSYLQSFHWQPLANGYSGYYPKSYLDLLHHLIPFPRGESLDVLRARGVRYVVVHENRYQPADFLDFDGRLRRTPGLRLAGYFPDETYPAVVFTLEPR